MVVQKKNETTQDGGKDENVFDIQQGVSINIFVKSRRGVNPKLFHYDVFGKRDFKYDLLANSKLKDINFSELPFESPYYFFTPNNLNYESGYENYVSISDLFKFSNSGVKTDRDSLFVDLDKSVLSERFRKLLSNNYDTDFVNKFRIINSGSFKITERIKGKTFNTSNIIKSNYRVFDDRFTYYDPSIISRPAQVVSKHIAGKFNLNLLTCRQQSTFDFQHVFITSLISDINSVSLQTKEITYQFPLYLYPESSGQLSLGSTETRTPNLNQEIVDQIAKGLGLKFVSEKDLTPSPSPQGEGSFAPVDLLDYIYAVLHSPTYRETYKEFLKIDFPRVPYPTDAAQFWKLVALGGELRQLHLMESPTLSQFITQYPVGGENEVEKISFVPSSRGRDDRSDLPVETASTATADLAVTGRVYINSDQYFDFVPEVAWNFYIGGYQPAQKWLKDRKGRILDFEDIMHYQRIIKALVETERVMREIDFISFF
jgi:predicted helicase